MYVSDWGELFVIPQYEMSTTKLEFIELSQTVSLCPQVQLVIKYKKQLHQYWWQHIYINYRVALRCVDLGRILKGALYWRCRYDEWCQRKFRRLPPVYGQIDFWARWWFHSGKEFRYGAKLRGNVQSCMGQVWDLPRKKICCLRWHWPSCIVEGR